MPVDRSKLLNKLPVGVWLTSKALQHHWKMSATQRKYIAQCLVNDGQLLRKGRTGNTVYQVAGPKKVIKSTSNKIDELISAVVKVGAENEILRTALKEIKETIEKALETSK